MIMVRSPDLHLAEGGCPGTDNRMPIYCNVMYAEMVEGDEVLSPPSNGQGALAAIAYRLSRGGSGRMSVKALGPGGLCVALNRRSTAHEWPCAANIGSTLGSRWFVELEQRRTKAW